MATHLNTFMDEQQITVKEPHTARVVGTIRYKPSSEGPRGWRAESIDHNGFSVARAFVAMPAAEYWILSEYLENEAARILNLERFAA